MALLESINSSSDIKKLSPSQLDTLCAELREFILSNVSKTGGHLASNLGTVELTVALHRIMDTETDRLVFDVGHQSYSHKIITGRRDKFGTLRQYQGLSGFPKPYEAPDDAFIAGHSSTSVSVALGMARARTLKKEDYKVACIIGDGALTGGLAYEGLSSVAASNEPMVVILNDNTMSISRNVGGVSTLLRRMRTKTAYFKLKKLYRAVMAYLPNLYIFNHRVKERVKALLLRENMFTSMGLEYLGPIDGHDVKQLESVLKFAFDYKKPVLVHVITVKGKGYKPAEERPKLYHGVGPFDLNTGELKTSGLSFSDVFGDSICELSDANKNIIGITAAMPDGTGLSRFKHEHFERFFDVGIAEDSAVTIGAGMAKQGLTPVFAVYSSFLQRGFDELIHDISLQKLHVVFAIDRAGLVGNDGETHHGVFDVSYLSCVPGMTVYAPASFAELKTMLDVAVNEHTGPVAIRYPRGGEGNYKDDYSGESVDIIKQGTDITVVTYGVNINDVIEASEKGDISCEIIKINKIKPLDTDKIFESVKKTGRLLVIEEVCDSGCVGKDIVSRMTLSGIIPKAVKLVNLGEGLVTHGSVAQLKKLVGLDADTIFKTISETVHEESQT